MWSRFFSNYSISFPLQGSKTCRYPCYQRMWRDAILAEEQMWAAVEAILKQHDICIASLRRDCRLILIQKNRCLDLLGFRQGLRMIWRYINDWMFLKNEDWLDSDWNGHMTWTYLNYLQSHCQMQRCWPGYLGRLRWDSATSESFISGNVWLLRRSRPGATQVRQQWRISLRSLVVDSSCTYHQSQFWIELSCSSALSKSVLDFHCANGSLNFEWPLPSHETGWPSTCWLKWTSAGTYS